MILDHFDISILKLNFKNKKYFNIFSSKKHFKKQPLLQSQVLSGSVVSVVFQNIFHLEIDQNNIFLIFKKYF
jgi:hypothetical protein